MSIYEVLSRIGSYIAYILLWSLFNQVVLSKFGSLFYPKPYASWRVCVGELMTGHPSSAILVSANIVH